MKRSKKRVMMSDMSDISRIEIDGASYEVMDLEYDVKHEPILDPEESARTGWNAYKPGLVISAIRFYVKAGAFRLGNMGGTSDLKFWIGDVEYSGPMSFVKWESPPLGPAKVEFTKEGLLSRAIVFQQ